MKRLSICVLSIAAFLTVVSCSRDEHFITSAEERAVLNADFEARRALLAEQGTDSLLDVLRFCNDLKTREAVQFIYAYSPLGDIADNTPEFFLKNIEYSFKAQAEMPWGAAIPEREFRHFVLPVRVNNEYLDSSRWVFYEELQERVRSLSLYDAVLEVNHWCHEKVVYRPSDARTSSPLQSVRTAYGRCGEESTFLVAALRSVGIPARQVYTPRWAHTDDNHAWVEAWVDGQWYFLGACEPEPILNLAWFNAPASRGMLMHTRAFGRYCGPEEVMSRTSTYTEINVTENYAAVAKCVVHVKDAQGNAVDGADVYFRMYNYAELFGMSRKKSDAGGVASLSAGMGDMVVWASKDGLYGIKKVSFGKDLEVDVVLSRTACTESEEIFDFVPPLENVQLPDVTPAQRAENDRRSHTEDSIRAAYESTFMTEDAAREVALRAGVDVERFVAYIAGSRGNWSNVARFVGEQPDKQQADRAMALLSVLWDKDLRDVTIEVLRDNMNEVDSNIPADIALRYVRMPRVWLEQLVPYKTFFKEVLNDAQKTTFRANPEALVDFVREYVKVDNECNLRGASITPIGVWRARVADELSRNIFFVALARSLDIPARIDQVTGKVQFVYPEVRDVRFVDSPQQDKDTAVESGTLVATYSPLPTLEDPLYYYHFTISKIENGQPRLLEYDEGDPGTEQGASWSSLLKRGTSLDPGAYMLTSGTRLASGGVLADVQFFTIRSGETTTIELKMRQEENAVKVIGQFDSESTYYPLDSEAPVSVLSTTGRGFYILGVLSVGSEPTNHAMRDIAAVKEKADKLGCPFLLLFTSEKDAQKFKPNEFGALPVNMHYGIDKDRSILNALIEKMNLDSKGALPVFIIADTFNRVVFVSQGYTIGLGEQMMNVMSKI